MNKNDLIQLIQENSHLTKKDIEVVIERYWEEVGNELAKNGSFSITNFGSFNVKTKHLHYTNSYRTGEADVTQIFFKCSKKLKAKLQSPDKLIFATFNNNKIKELKQIFPNLKIVLLTDLCDNDTVLETGNTFRENAYLKASHYYNKYKCAVLAEDSGLSVRSLNNAPGVYSARFSVTGKDEDNNDKLLQSLKGQLNRTAYYSCCFCYIDKYGGVNYFEGKVEGTIATEYRGTNGFGYDPLFIENKSGKTFGELPAEYKNKISHRAVALNKLKNYLGE
jgi:XTP/dITP diphosphohydrolase